MIPHHHHGERHVVDRIGWLRAAVLGANDGLLSVSSILVGVAAAQPGIGAISLAGIAGLTAGAMSMAAGEYVSVSSQADAERSDRDREMRELERDPDGEHAELAAIYRGRGLDAALADQVATQMTAHDALGAHLRDELGLTDVGAAQPVQAAVASAVSFAVGAAIPLAAALVTPEAHIATVVVATTIVLLAVLGGIGAQLGRAPLGRGMARVLFWGVAAMTVSYFIGKWAGATL